MRVTFRRLEREDLGELTEWFRDPLLARRISPPDGAWQRYVLEGGIARSWVGLDASGKLVCEVQVDRDGPDEPGYIDYYLRPDLRGRGLASGILEDFLAGPGSRYSRLIAAIETDNVASLRCFRRCGFKARSMPSEESGMTELFRDRD